MTGFQITINNNRLAPRSLANLSPLLLSPFESSGFRERKWCFKMFVSFGCLCSHDVSLQDGEGREVNLLVLIRYQDLSFVFKNWKNNEVKYRILEAKIVLCYDIKDRSTCNWITCCPGGYTVYWIIKDTWYKKFKVKRFLCCYIPKDLVPILLNWAWNVVWSEVTKNCVQASCFVN